MKKLTILFISVPLLLILGFWIMLINPLRFITVEIGDSSYRKTTNSVYYVSYEWIATNFNKINGADPKSFTAYYN